MYKKNSLQRCIILKKKFAEEYNGPSVTVITRAATLLIVVGLQTLFIERQTDEGFV